ncbi:hypothetical protein K491DRAFT_738902, partial [Lophiostoma macrostomum CBS 122681]
KQLAIRRLLPIILFKAKKSTKKDKPLHISTRKLRMALPNVNSQDKLENILQPLCTTAGTNERRQLLLEDADHIFHTESTLFQQNAWEMVKRLKDTRTWEGGEWNRIFFSWDELCGSMHERTPRLVHLANCLSAELKFERRMRLLELAELLGIGTDAMNEIKDPKFSALPELEMDAEENLELFKKLPRAQGRAKDIKTGETGDQGK